MKKYKQTIQGFSLLEMMLVLVIMSTIIVMLVNLSENKLDQFRRDKAALQIQQILNAALSYYASNGSWPVGSGANLGNCTAAGVQDLTPTQVLQTSGFLPSAITISNPWFNAYKVSCTTLNGLNNFIVTTDTGSTANATILAGQLPLAGVTGAPATSVTAQVPIPGQNLNNARSINYMGLYHSGGCVPVPTCPNGMTASLYVFPASVNGINTQPPNCNGNPPVCTGGTANPIEGFTAYATQPGIESATPSCGDPAVKKPCYAKTTTAPWPVAATGSYWRVCLQVVTPQGVVAVSSGVNPNASSTAADIGWAANVGTIVAATRCTPTNEPVGSTVNVWSP